MNPVIIDGCDSGVENHIFEDGCTISDRIAECAAGARNHGELVSCVAHLTDNLSVVDLSPAKKRVPADSAINHYRCQLSTGLRGVYIKMEGQACILDKNSIFL